MSRKPVALVDMDGTLVDFDGAMRRDLTAMLGPNEEPLLEHEHENLKHIWTRRDFIKRRPDWWFNLEKIPRGFAVLDMLREVGFKLTILTRGPKNNAQAWAEKVKWCRLHVPDANITITHDKSQYYGRVLVDDWPDYVRPWLRHRERGLVIMPSHKYNQDFSHPQVIRLTEDNDAEILAALKAQRDRK